MVALAHLQVFFTFTYLPGGISGEHVLRATPVFVMALTGLILVSALTAAK